MTCESCVQDVSGSLHKLEGITKVDANLKDQLISIEGTGSLFPTQPDMVVLGRTVVLTDCDIAAPSAIVSAIQGTGRDAILRGTGTTDGKL